MTQIIAFAIWQNRISPVFDGSRAVMVLEIESGLEKRRTYVPLKTDSPNGRADELAELGIETLVCGAISEPYFRALESAGIRVEAFVSGDGEQVLETFVKRGIFKDTFRMPGCGRGRRRRFRGGVISH